MHLLAGLIAYSQEAQKTRSASRRTRSSGCLISLAYPELTLISILENYTRAILASKMSLTQNQWDYMEVLFAALSRFGVPSAIVSDGGGIFYCAQTPN